MSLFSFSDFYSEFGAQARAWRGGSLKSYTVCTGNKAIGSVKDLLVDESGNFRYLAIEASFDNLSKAVLITIGLVRFDYSQGCVSIDGLNADCLRRSPSYDDGINLSRSYEQRVRDAYRAIAACRAGRRFLQQPYTSNGQFTGGSSGYSPSSAQDYSHNPTFYGMSDRDNQRPLKHLENCLAAQLSAREESSSAAKML